MPKLHRMLESRYMKLICQVKKPISNKLSGFLGFFDVKNLKNGQKNEDFEKNQ